MPLFLCDGDMRFYSARLMFARVDSQLPQRASVSLGKPGGSFRPVLLLAETPSHGLSVFFAETEAGHDSHGLLERWPFNDPHSAEQTVG